MNFLGRQCLNIRGFEVQQRSDEHGCIVAVTSRFTRRGLSIACQGVLADLAGRGGSWLHPAAAWTVAQFVCQWFVQQSIAVDPLPYLWHLPCQLMMPAAEVAVATACLAIASLPM
jgi:hypothetical protein